MQAGCAKAAEWIDVLGGGVETCGESRNIVLDGVLTLREGFQCGLCQITLAICCKVFAV